MQKLKGSPQALITLGLLALIGNLPATAAEPAIALFSAKATLVASNLPGPAQPLQIAGAPVTQILFWVPQAGDIGTGVSMLLLSWFGVWRLRRGEPPRALLWMFSAFTFSGWIATLAGWLVTEIGRQPWLVTGILRTADAAGKITGAELGASLTVYVLTYSLMLLAYFVVITHMAGKGAQA